MCFGNLGNLGSELRMLPKSSDDGQSDRSRVLLVGVTDLTDQARAMPGGRHPIWVLGNTQDIGIIGVIDR